MRVCIVTNGVETSQVFMQFPDFEAVIQKTDNDLISTFLFREGCLYANSLKNVQSNFGWRVQFSPMSAERYITAPVLGSVELLKTKIRSIIPSHEEVEFLEYQKLASI